MEWPLKRFWIIFSIALISVVVTQLFIEIYGQFEIESWFGFGAWYGFFTCVGMVLFAKFLGLMIKKPDDYYSRSESKKNKVEN